VPPPGGQGTGRRREGAVERYTIQDRIASGGMGDVYRVLDASTGELRALKRMSPDAAGRPLLIEAFEREYRVLASLDHPRIIRVFDYEVDDEGPYYTMELLEGTDMRQAAPLEYRQACHYLRDVATSLALLHVRRLIHRDLSPSNVRTTADGHCKLLDFGALASFGMQPMIVGTPPVIPPEALAESPLDQRADLYALGALAYWMLTRRHAFPARRIQDLRELWMQPPEAPSAHVPGIPAELDTLVLSLLSADPLARPASAAEVIARLRVIGDLPEEDATETSRLAQSFLLSPPFTGRGRELAELEGHVRSAVDGRGGAIRLQAAAGMGRSRLLEEVTVRAQLAGAAVVRIDASMHRQHLGAVRAIVTRLFDGFPDVARRRSVASRLALSTLGKEIEARLPLRTWPSGAGRRPSSETTGTIEDFLVAFSDEKPLVLLVDNVEYADPGSLGTLAGLAARATRRALLLVVTERTRREESVPLGLATLRSHAAPVVLSPFRPTETLELVRSVFGDSPNVERFSEWLQGRAAGSPLHTVEITRHLVERGVVEYAGGVWILPADRPDAELPAALEDSLSLRIQSLSDDARALAECLSLQRQEPTLELCRLLVGGDDERVALRLLDELARTDVLHADRDGYRFSSTALREALLSGMDGTGKIRNHRRLGEAFAALAGDRDPRLRIEAGYHLIRGADEIRGADLIASVTYDAVTARKLIADLHHIGKPLEAALMVYKRQRRSSYERLPILAALSHAGYYEERFWGERYGDEALDVLEYVAGLRTARRLRPVLGRWLGLFVAMTFAIIRFYLVPRAERPYSFAKVLVQLFGAVTTLTGAASLSLDVERAGVVASVLEPFSFLPERLTPVGIYQFCRGLQQIGLENEAAAFRTFDTLLRRFENPRFYPSLPADARELYVAGAHFARGAFAIFRADGRTALDSADALDAAGMKLYRMIASQLRFLYHVNRGELAKAAPHRAQVELHAAHVGSAWQVENWEASALILVNTALGDVVECTRVTKRLGVMSETVPSLRLYAHLARLAQNLVSHESILAMKALADEVMSSHPPRGFIGWAAVHANAARGCYELGEHERDVLGRADTPWFRVARDYCERVTTLMSDDDREYVSMFLFVDIAHAEATAALGDTRAAFERLDALLERFRMVDHPLVHGPLHEARAKIAWRAGMVDEYRKSAAQVEGWFRPTGTPSLIAKCDRLNGLGSRGDALDSSTGSRRPPTPDDAKTVVEIRDDLGTASLSPPEAPTDILEPRRA